MSKCNHVTSACNMSGNRSRGGGGNAAAQHAQSIAQHHTNRVRYNTRPDIRTETEPRRSIAEPSAGQSCSNWSSAEPWRQPAQARSTVLDVHRGLRRACGAVGCARVQSPHKRLQHVRKPVSHTTVKLTDTTRDTPEVSLQQDSKSIKLVFPTDNSASFFVGPHHNLVQKQDNAYYKVGMCTPYRQPSVCQRRPCYGPPSTRRTRPVLVKVAQSETRWTRSHASGTQRGTTYLTHLPMRKAAVHPPFFYYIFFILHTRSRTRGVPAHQGSTRHPSPTRRPRIR